MNAYDEGKFLSHLEDLVEDALKRHGIDQVYAGVVEALAEKVAEQSQAASPRLQTYADTDAMEPSVDERLAVDSLNRIIDRSVTLGQGTVDRATVERAMEMLWCTIWPFCAGTR